MVDPFVEETGAEVIVEYGFTSGSIAKVQAQAADPQLDVVLMDDIGVLTVAPGNLLAAARSRQNPQRGQCRRALHRGRWAGDRLLYLCRYPALQHGPPIPPHQSPGGILWSENLVNKASIPTSNQTPALHVVIAAAIVAGGDQLNPDPGFRSWRSCARISGCSLRTRRRSPSW